MVSCCCYELGQLELLLYRCLTKALLCSAQTLQPSSLSPTSGRPFLIHSMSISPEYHYPCRKRISCLESRQSLSISSTTMRGNPATLSTSPSTRCSPPSSSRCRYGESRLVCLLAASTRTRCLGIRTAPTVESSRTWTIGTTGYRRDSSGLP